MNVDSSTDEAVAYLSIQESRTRASSSIGTDVKKYLEYILDDEVADPVLPYADFETGRGLLANDPGATNLQPGVDGSIRLRRC